MSKYKRKFNESYDVHADVYNWFNDYCDDIEKSDSDLKYELEGIDVTELAQQAVDELSLDDSYIDLVDTDLISFIEDRLDEINNGPFDTSFNKNNSDWLDKYNNRADYSASLESYKKANKMVRRKSTLEQRINRLEKLLSSNRRSRKFEDVNADMTTELTNLLDENDCWPDNVAVTQRGDVEVTLDWDYFGIAKFYVSQVGDGFVVKSNRSRPKRFATLDECAEYIAAEDHNAADDL